MNLKAQVEGIVSCIADGTNISTILLKAQAIAFALKNMPFSNLITNEQNGWNNIDEIPSYRNIPCLVKAKVAIPYEGERIINIPVSNFDNKIYVHISKMRINEPISTIESISSNIKNYDGSREISVEIPTCFYPNIQKMLRFGEIQMAWQYTDASSIASIIDKLKSAMLAFFLKLNEEIDLNVNFNIMNRNADIERIVNNTIYAGVVHTGPGAIEIDNSNVVGGQKNTVIISAETKEQLSEIVRQIQTISQEMDDDRTDIADAILTLREELDSKVPRPRFLKTAFNGLKAIGAGVLVDKITPLVNRALELIPKL